MMKHVIHPKAWIMLKLGRNWKCKARQKGKREQKAGVLVKTGAKAPGDGWVLMENKEGKMENALESVGCAGILELFFDNLGVFLVDCCVEMEKSDGWLEAGGGG